MRSRAWAHGAVTDVSSIPPDLNSLTLNEFRKAIAIYLEVAYPDAEPPEAVRRRLEWDDSLGMAELLSRPPFERINRQTSDVPTIHALRLGNHRYMHMKLQVQPWPNEDGFLLSVNTHDQALSLRPDSKDADAFRDLQAENQRIKEAIEQAWDQAGIPTFLRYLRDYIDRHPGQPPKPES